MRLPPRRAHRIDANQPSIVKDLRKAKVFWLPAGEPIDGWVGWKGLWLPCEIKDPSKPLSARRLTPTEAMFFQDAAAYGLPVILAHTAEDVFAAFDRQWP